MTGTTTLARAARALQEVARRRSLEVLLLQASPLLGAAFGGGIGAIDSSRWTTLLAGSVLLTAHVFVFNDWAGHRGDLNDPRRAPHVFDGEGIGRGAAAAFAVALLAAGMAVLAALGVHAVVIGLAIACLGFLYSDSHAAGKGTPIFASLIHLMGGTLHFLLGYAVTGTIDARGLAIGLFFGLVFAAGHLNQEVRDHDADARNGIRTTAVVFGPRRASLASLALFSAAYGELAILARIDVVPRQLLWATLLWPLQVAWSLPALRGEPGFEQARRLQRRYRVLFAILGLVMVLALVASGTTRQPASSTFALR